MTLLVSGCHRGDRGSDAKEYRPIARDAPIRMRTGTPLWLSRTAEQGS